MTEKQSMSERKRAAILAAAIDEFDQRGFQKTSMDQIAASANVSKRTVYNHFPSKDLLFKEITSSLWQQGAAATEFDYLPETELEPQLRAIAEQEMALLRSAEFIRMARLVVAECFHSPEMAQKTLAQMDQSSSGLKRWLDHAVADGRMQMTDSEFAAAQFFSLVKSFVFWPQIVGYGESPSSEHVEQIISSSVSMFLKQYSV